MAKAASNTSSQCRMHCAISTRIETKPSPRFSHQPERHFLFQIERSNTGFAIRLWMRLAGIV